MKYMLDTNICIYLIKKKPVKVIQRLLKVKLSDICISSITLSELEYGVSKSAYSQKNKVALLEFLTPLEILSYDDLAAKEYGGIRVFLEKKGKTIGSLDMLIAAHVKSRNLILITNNEKEFKRIPKLKIENWAK